MAEHRIHFKNHGGHYFATAYFHAYDNNNAVSTMHRMHVPFIGRGLKYGRETASSTHTRTGPGDKRPGCFEFS